MKHTIIEIDWKDILAFGLVLAIIAGFILFGAFIESRAEANQLSHLYPITALVSELDYSRDIVVFEDDMGFRWAMSGIEDWRPGDGASLLMHDNGTASIYDDKIITARFSTWNLN